MQVKIDTKEKFHVITPIEHVLSASMTEGMRIALRPFLQNSVKNVIVNMTNVVSIDAVAAEHLLIIQQEYYENSASFVCCNLQKDVEAFLAEIELLELLNVTPTESEAWDIVQMEEIEREIMNGDDDDPELEKI